MHKILKNVIDMVDYSLQKLKEGQSEKLPNEYQEVDYIESNGTQYIDTLYTPVEGDEFEFENIGLKRNSSGALFSAGVGTYQIILLGYQYFKYFSSGTATSIQIDDRTKVENIKVKYENGKGNLYVNNEFKGLSTYGGAVDTTLNLFRRANGQNYADVKTGKIKIKNNGVIKLNLVPCYRKADNVVGMYDTVNQVFYVNEGTGEFGYEYNNQKLEPTGTRMLNMQSLDNDLQQSDEMEKDVVEFEENEKK